MSTANFSHEPDDSFNLQRYIQCDLGYICDDEDDYGACECVWLSSSIVHKNKIRDVSTSRLLLSSGCVCVSAIFRGPFVDEFFMFEFNCKNKDATINDVQSLQFFFRRQKEHRGIWPTKIWTFIWAMPMVGQVVNFSANNIIFTIMYMVGGRSREVNKIHLLLDLRADG